MPPGEISHRVEVMCWGCGDYADWAGSSVRDAKVDAERIGWKKLKDGKWRCPKCKDSPEKQCI